MDWGQKMQAAKGEERRVQYTKKDVVAEVIGYPRLSTGTEPGVLHARDVSTGRELFISIMDSNKGQFNAKAPMQGNMIDDRMKSFLSQGDMVVIESMVDGPDVGNSVDRPAFARYVSSLPTDESKIVSGILTMHGSTKACFDVQHWEKQALTAEDLAQRMEFSDAADFYRQSLAQKNETGRGMGIKGMPGVQFRILDKSGQLVGMTPQLLNHALDESLPKEERYRPLTTEEVVTEFAEFEDWVQKVMPGCHVEAAVFTQYKASAYLTWETDKGTNVPGHLQKVDMCLGKGRMMSNDEASFPRFGGGVLACEGVLKLSPGKIDQRRGVRVGAENQFASEVWVNAKPQHVHALIADVNGNQITIHPKMAIEMPHTKQYQEQDDQRQSSKPQSEMSQKVHGPESVESEQVATEEPPIELYEVEVDQAIFDEMSQASKPRGMGM